MAKRKARPPVATPGAAKITPQEAEKKLRVLAGDWNMVESWLAAYRRASITKGATKRRMLGHAAAIEGQAAALEEIGLAGWKLPWQDTLDTAIVIAVPIGEFLRTAALALRQNANLPNVRMRVDERSRLAVQVLWKVREQTGRPHWRLTAALLGMEVQALRNLAQRRLWSKPEHLTGKPALAEMQRLGMLRSGGTKGVQNRCCDTLFEQFP